MTMVKEIIFKELRENLNTVRFYLILILTILLFVVSSITFVRNYGQKVLDYRSDTTANESLLVEKSEDLLVLARFKQGLLKKPNPSELLSEANEKILPNKFLSDIFYLDFPEVEGRSNVLLRGFNTVDWEFVIAVVLSFLAFVLSYDAVCGEKEQNTLSLIFSNSIKTIKVFSGKFFGLLITLSIPVAVGALLGLLIINLSGEISINYGKVVVFLLVSLVFLRDDGVVHFFTICHKCHHTSLYLDCFVFCHPGNREPDRPSVLSHPQKRGNRKIYQNGSRRNLRHKIQKYRSRQLEHGPVCRMGSPEGTVEYGHHECAQSNL